MSSALPRAFSQRGKTQTEIERENFEKFQTISIQKAINQAECPVKEKHVRTAIIGTFQDGGGTMFWAVADRLALQGNPIICWKFCYTLHKILRDGHTNVIPESQKYTNKLVELGKLWGHLKDSYGKLIKLYTKLLTQKLAFHRKYGQIPGSLKLDDDEFVRIIGRDVDAQFEVSVDMMDYMDDILALQVGVFGSLDMSRSNSMTASGQCRLAPLVQCILESALLYDYIVKLLFKLHSSLPPDTLTGHRSRFAQQFKALNQFFYSSKNLQYYKNLIQVPSLPEQAPNFLIASELSQHARPVAVVAEVAEESLVDTAEPEHPPPAVPNRFDSMARFSDDDKRDKRMHDMKQELEALKRRMRQMESDSHFEMNQCTEELRRRTKELESIRSLLDQMIAERDELINQKQQFTEELDSRVDNVQKQAQASEDKFKKMKDIYNKLREDHVTLLRSNGEAQKLVKKLNHDVDNGNERMRELAGQLDLARNEKSMLQESLQQAGDNSNTELLEAKSSVLQLEQEKQDLLDRLHNAQKAKEIAEHQATNNEDAIKDLEMTKMNLESQVRELEEKLSDLQINQTSLSDSVQHYQNQISDLTQKEQNAKTNLTQSEARCIQLQSEKEELESRIEEQNRQNLIERQRMMNSLMEDCLQQSAQTIINRVAVLEEPSVFSVRCSPEFLLELLESAMVSLNELGDKLANGDWLCKVHDLVQMVSDCLLFAKATSNSAPTDYGQTLAKLCTECGQALLAVIAATKAVLDDPNADINTKIQTLEEIIKQMMELAEKVRPKIKDVKADEIGEMVEQEMTSTTSAIEEAASHFEELLAQSRRKDTGAQLEVNERIIDSCTQLMQNIRILIEKARTLQKEIVAAGRGASSVHDFYKKHSRWTEGLLSAAKSVAFGAKALLGSADKVVLGEGKFEELIVCSQEIAACTTQLVVASQVKADPQSKALQDLKKASGGVTTATGNVVAQAKSCAEIRDEQVMQDLSNISLTQSKRMEMNSQVKVLELESALNQERVRLAALRKKHYQLAGESEGWEPEDINNADGHS